MPISQDEPLAALAVERLRLEDGAVLALGIAVNHVGLGEVELLFTPSADMGNGHGVVHGGFVFTFADTAFAYAYASRGVPGVTVNATIDFLAPAQVGVELIAHASEFHRDGSTGIYDVRVTDSAGRVIAVFRGHGRTPRKKSTSPAPRENVSAS